MAEILTESFCERCGSRYTFESAVPRARLRGVKVLSRGLRNFVLDDKTSIDEAMAAARDDTDRSLTSHQLEAFHKTFNFCMQCRQYICPNCWNDGEGRCLTCAPTLGRGILPSPFPHLDPSAGIAPAPEDGLAAAAMNGHQHVADEPSGNGFDAIGRLDALTEATASTAPTELVGSSEVEARAAVEPDVAALSSPEPTIDIEASASAPVADAPAAEPERFIYDPYDPPPPAPPEAVVVEALAVSTEPEVVAEVAPEPEVVAEVVTSAPEPEVVAEAAAGSELVVKAPDVAAEPEVVAEAPVAPKEVAIEAETAASPDEVDAASDRAAAVAAHTSLVLAGLKPGESLDDALAAFEAEPTEAESAETEVTEVAEAVAAEALIEDVATQEPVDAADAAVETVATQEPVDHHFLEAAAIAALARTPDEAESTKAPEAAEPSEPADAILVAEAPVAEAPVVDAPVVDAPVVDAPVHATAPEPMVVVEPLDEIPIGEAVAFEAAAHVQPDAEPEPAWQAEPLDDIMPAEAVETPAEAIEPAVIEAAVVESAVEAAPEPVVAEPVADEPTAVEAAPEPAAPAIPESSDIAAAAAADDIVAQPTWSILAPDPRPVTDVPGPLADAPAPGIEPLAPAAMAAPPTSAEPSWPAQPQWPDPQPSTGLPFLGRPVVPTGGVDALWAESSQAVSAPRTGTDKPAGGVQPCTSCGLSLSASARFCRRCGTSQVG